MKKIQVYTKIDKADFDKVTSAIKNSKNNYIGTGTYLHYSETYRCYVLDKKKPTGKDLWTGDDPLQFLEHRVQSEFISHTIIPSQYERVFPNNCPVRGKHVISI